MRLNRVLQLTAGVAIAMAATIFTISCSGEDGSSGRDGSTDCRVEPNGNGYDVFCGSNRLGTLTGGPAGANGQPGSQGPDGTGCELKEIDGAYKIFCGGSEKGTINGCSLSLDEEYQYESTLTCGSSVISFCNSVPFDPATNFCDASYGYSRPLSAECVTGTGTNATAVKFNINKQYCGYRNQAAYTAKTPSVLNYCGTLSDKALNQAVYIGTSEDGVFRFGWSTTAEYTNRAFDNVAYCRVKVSSADQETGKILYKDTVENKPILCDGKAIKPNEGSWKGEYCGFEKASDLLRKLVSGACGDGTTPNEVAWYKGYCRMESKTSKFTTISSDFCETGAAPENKTVNAVNKLGVLTAGDWLGQYCGFASQADLDAGKKSVLSKVCDDDQGPNGDDMTTWENQYCQAQKDDDGKVSTIRVGGGSDRNIYCMKDGRDNFATAGSDQRINENTWKNEYCGYESKSAGDSETPSRLTGVCDDGSGPNAGGWANEYCRADKTGKTAVSDEFCGIAAVPATKSTTGSLNEGSWKDEYCGFASKADFEANPKVKSVLKGVCSDDKEPNASAWLNEYCQADKTGKTAIVGIDGLNTYCLADTTGADYTVAPASARINEKTWKNEYCGFASKANFEAEPQVFSKLTGVCGDDDGPNAATSSYTAWNNEYCQGDKDSKPSKVVGGPSVYCIENAGDVFAGLSGSAATAARLNENTWKGEYCFADFAKAVCPGGLANINEAKSTDNPRCEFAN